MPRHRLLVGPAQDVNLHVWPQDAPEPIRHRLFRDWLRAHPADRDRYATAKRRLARDTADRASDYSLAKNDVIDQILARAFAAAGAVTAEPVAPVPRRTP
ncbi:GrpB family protein [Micromonospora sp. NPDC050686]|uniref:GrpB family protein n=1 Tax=Micromonospora sp. NPDC050686 TaxID=3154631 RepID=UPI0033DB1DD4